MAAPRSSQSVEDDEELNLTSPRFNPLKALYTKESVKLPSSTVTQFNNISEYESFLKKKVRGNAEKNLADTSNKDKIATEMNPLSKRASVNKSKVVKELPPRDPILNIRNNRWNRNVLTKMGKLQKGPLSLLNRCVTEKLLVKVWTRGATDLRGICKGYVIAFDKHFNLAMIDVDEQFRCPLSRDKELKRQNKAEKRYIKYMKKKLANCEANKEQLLEPTVVKSELCSRYLVTTNVTDVSSTTDSDSDVSRKCSVLTLDKKENLNIIMQKTLQNDSLVGAQHKIVSHSTERILEENIKVAELEKESDQNLDIKETHESDRFCGMEMGTSKVTYKQRHVNQLFIRGDNVVSVAIVD